VENFAFGDIAPPFPYSYQPGWNRRIKDFNGTVRLVRIMGEREEYREIERVRCVRRESARSRATARVSLKDLGIVKVEY